MIYSNKFIIVDSTTVLTRHLSECGIDQNNIALYDNIHSAQSNYAFFAPKFVIINLDSIGNEGFSFMQWANAQDNAPAIIAVASTASETVTASAIRSGATEFLNLNLGNVTERLKDRLLRADNAMRSKNVPVEQRNLLNNPESELFIGNSPAMREVSQLILNAAKSDASVFITGENGTGKEVCATLLHKFSKRNNDPVVAINCAAIPHGLAESELFGHVKGAFTGAHSDRIGVAEQAKNGTLFLDEIGEMDLEIQSKLLRFVQSGSFNPVGSSETRSVDTRFVCATNRDPKIQISAGQFREDLFYRLNVVQIHLPPLRVRGNDILILANRFLNQFSLEEEKQFLRFSSETQALLKGYSWPGNIRELQNVIRNIVVLYEGDVVIPSMLPNSIIEEQGDRRQARASKSAEENNNTNAEPLQATDSNVTAIQSTVSTADQKNIRILEEVIEENIRYAIEFYDGNITEASTALGISPSTIYRKMKKHDIAV